MDSDSLSGSLTEEEDAVMARGRRRKRLKTAAYVTVCRYAYVHGYVVHDTGVYCGTSLT